MQADKTQLFDWAATWRARGLALLKFVVFSAAFIAFQIAAAIFLPAADRPIPGANGSYSIAALAVGRLVTGGGVVFASVIVFAIWRDTAQTFGLGRIAAAGRQMLIGAAVGALGVVGLLAVTAATGGFYLGSVVLNGGEIVRYGAALAIIFAVTAFAEDSFFRGFGFVQLSRAITIVPAMLVYGGWFALIHRANGGETVVGLINVGLFGVLGAYAFKRTGALWFGFGLHACWDYTQSFIFGVPDSGNMMEGALMHSTLTGSPWLTGGPAGPEGTWLCTAVTLAIGIGIYFATSDQTPKSDRVVREKH